MCVLRTVGLEQEINCALGYSFKVLKQGIRQVRKGGVTERNMWWIEKVYPRYKFYKDNNGNLTHGLLVVELQKDGRYAVFLLKTV